MFGFLRNRKCRSTRRRLSPYLDGLLPPDEREAIEHHVEACQRCRRELASLRATVHLLHRVGTSPLPRSFAIAEVRPAPRQAWRPAWVRLGTAVAVTILAFLLISDAAGFLGPGLVGPQKPSAEFQGLPSNQSAFNDSQGKVDEQLAAPTTAETIPSGGAGTWLGALEIGVSALAVTLGSLTVFIIAQKRRRATR